MDFVDKLAAANEYNKDSFEFTNKAGYTFDIRKLNKNEKSYGLYICEPGDNKFYKVGLIRNPKSLEKALFG